MKRVIIAATAVMLLITGCTYDDSNEPYNPPILTTYYDDDDVVVAADTSNKRVYLSYDDSASSASFRLVQHYLTTNEVSRISPSWGRSWEYLNFEEFTSATSVKLGFLDLDMGIKTREVNATTFAYEFGAHVKSDYLDTTQRAPVVLTLIVDVSGSMGNVDGSADSTKNRLELVKQGLTRLKSFLKEGDIVSIVKFSDTAQTIRAGLAISAADSLTQFQSAVDSLYLAGGTNLNAGINEGYRVAQQYYDSTKQNRVVILTDAKANQGEVDPTLIAQKTQINNAEGIYFSGLGIGSDFNEAFLNELTEKGKGAYFTIISGEDINRVMGVNLPALLNVAARDVRFYIDYPSELTHVFSAAEEASSNPDEVSKTNFSFNTDQYFYELFESSKDSLSLADLNITLGVTYLDPVTYAERNATFSLRIGDLVSKQQNNIQEARVIVTLAGLVSHSITCEEANTIVANTSYSSSRILEYKEYIRVYCSAQ